MNLFLLPFQYKWRCNKQKKIRFSSTPGILLTFQLLSLLKPELNYNVATEYLLLFDLMKIQQTFMIQFMMMYSGALHVLAMFTVYCLHVDCLLWVLFKTAVLQITNLPKTMK